MALRILVFDNTLGFHREIETSEVLLGLKGLVRSIENIIGSHKVVTDRIVIFDHAQRRLRSMEPEESVIGFSAAQGEPDSPYPLLWFHNTVDYSVECKMDFSRPIKNYTV